VGSCIHIRHSAAQLAAFRSGCHLREPRDVLYRHGVLLHHHHGVEVAAAAAAAAVCVHSLLGSCRLVFKELRAAVAAQAGDAVGDVGAVGGGVFPQPGGALASSGGVVGPERADIGALSTTTVNMSTDAASATGGGGNP